MLDKNKTNERLGILVNDHLTAIGINTPTTERLYDEEIIKLGTIEQNFKNILLTLGMDLSDDSLEETPSRMSKMWVKELNWGLFPENFPKCTTVQNKMKYDEMVIEKNITVMSICEHHGVVIDGLCNIAYIPNEKVLGLSKLNRIVEYFSRRPQIQERLTQQIAETLKFILDTEDVAVTINAVHYCVKSRGVGDQSSNTITSYTAGAFRDNSDCRREFIALCS